MNEELLNKDTPIPLYFQLKEIIKEKINKDELQPGDLVPSETKLKRKYNISRSTIRQALSELVNEGLLYRKKGKGTFVAEEKINYGFIQQFATFYDDMKKKGYKTKTKVYDLNVDTASKIIANKLNIKKGQKVITIDRIRYINDEPIVLVSNNIPYNLCPELKYIDLDNKSLYKIMSDKYGIVPYKAEITLEPTIADNYDKKLLNIKPGFPIQLMRNITYTENGIIMDYFESKFRGDKGKVKVELYKE